MMLPVIQVLVFGAWLVAQSTATAGAPSISIFLKPPGTIPPGGSTTVCCSCKCDNGNFVLLRHGHRVNTLPRLRGSRAEFSISNVTQGDAGGYSCHYVDREDRVLARSETVEVRVYDFHLPEPVLSVQPGSDVVAGVDVVFRCTIPHPRAGCFLYLEGWVAEFQRLSPGEGYQLSRVSKDHEGRYSCQCFAKSASIEWSAVSKTLDLVVRDSDYTQINVMRLALGAGVLLLLGLIVAIAICSHQCRKRSQ